MGNVRTFWTSEEGEFITQCIINGDSIEFAKAKVCRGIINEIGPSLSDATDSMKQEYRDAKQTLKSLGYKIECGILYPL